jgi:mRNA interferase RelE/StbE
MHSVFLTDRARRFYEDADAPLQNRLDRYFNQLKETPRQHPNITALKGALSGRYRFRLGDYRIIYRVDDAQRLVIVDIIAHRRDAYE